MKTSKMLVLAAIAAAMVAAPLVMAQSADKEKNTAGAAQDAPVDKAQVEAEQKAKRRAAAAAQEKARADQPAPREEEEEESRRR